jgi:hypothetical protein
MGISINSNNNSAPLNGSIQSTTKTANGAGNASNATKKNANGTDLGHDAIGAGVTWALLCGLKGNRLGKLGKTLCLQGGSGGSGSSGKGGGDDYGNDDYRHMGPPGPGGGKLLNWARNTFADKLPLASAPLLTHSTNTDLGSQINPLNGGPMKVPSGILPVPAGERVSPEISPEILLPRLP